MNNYQALLTEKKCLISDQLLLKFSLVEPKQIVFKAGQYIMLKVNGQTRLYSIFSSEKNQDSFELMIKFIPNGLASSYFSNLKVGDRVEFQGPAGVFYLRENQKNKFFLATYTGLAPFWSMITSYFEKNPNSKTNFTLYWGVKNYEETCLLDQLKQMAQKYSSFKFFICLSREDNLNKVPVEDKKYFKIGRVNTTLEEYNNQSDYYLCGSREVVDGLNQYLSEKGIAKENIFFEKF
jgi:NAD(P)H-flavin reductase